VFAENKTRIKYSHLLDRDMENAVYLHGKADKKAASIFIEAAFSLSFSYVL